MFNNINAMAARILLGGAGVIIFLLGFLIVADVIGRAFFAHPVKGTPEMVSMSIVIVCFLLAAYAIQTRSMISTDVLVGAFGFRGHEFATLMSGILGAIFFGFICWGSFEPAIYAWTSGEFEGEGALHVPAWPARFTVLTGSFLAAMTYAYQAIMALRALFMIQSKPTV